MDTKSGKAEDSWMDFDTLRILLWDNVDAEGIQNKTSWFAIYRLAMFCQPSA